ncbi:activator of Hsp90 ATPase [Globomyces pollinis-pini]|nr:activator of Hsp90 ATPase [Globomyces pollinis-pini]
MAATGTNWKNVNDWHWVDKNCLPWAKNYFTKKLINQTIAVDGTTVTVSEVSDVTGDCDLNQRKGQIIHIFDVALKLKWKGTNAKGTEATGNITMPEIMHDTEIDEIVLDIELDSPTRETEEIKAVVRKSLGPIIRSCFTTFSKDLMEANAKDVHITKEEMTGHPTLQTYKPKPPVAALKETTATAKTSIGGLVTINQTLEFQCSVGDLFDTLVNPNKIQMWSRSPCEFSKLINATFNMFGGNISGTVIKIVDNESIELNWRIKSWPVGHFSKVTLNFKQGSDGTTLKLVQTLVPIGEKASTEANWNNYYWNSIKRTFGFGAIL